MSKALQIRLGVSACLLGQEVRYDGRHKAHAFLTQGPEAWSLALEREGLEWTLVPVCPEVELGLGTPREPIHLVQAGERVRLQAPGSGLDHTADMQRFAEERVAELLDGGLDGYVLKSRSPSCGLAVDLQTLAGPVHRAGRGLFAQHLCRAHPGLPLCEEQDLDDEDLRAAFLERVALHAELRHLVACDLGRDALLSALLEFHARQSLRLDALEPGLHAALRVALLHAPPAVRAETYAQRFLSALAGASREE